MSYVLPPPSVTSVPVQGSDARFPVRRIFCVGRNYEEHAREMGADTREPPFFFTKPADALVTDGAAAPWPSATQDLHHEAELVVALGAGGVDVSPDDALSLVWGYAPGNDLTRRDLQAAAKAARRPWDMSKAFDASAPCGTLVPVSVCGHPAKGRITCTVDGKVTQNADIADMIWDVPHIIAHLSGLVRLAPGDLIFTGTPAGVGPVQRGQTVSVTVEGLGSVETRIT
jgi:fumarylpyruvate hydrolase